ncbi:MAG: zf-HC2 domain-containing protein [Thermodesulfobacteriota bacterium]
MDCRAAEFYIVDYFLEDLDTDSKEDLLEHLKSCDECRVSYVKYKELLNISRVKDNKNLPRFEILDRLQQIARINSQKDDSFLKKITKFRFLVPIFGSSMVLMIFLNLETGSYLNLKKDDHYNTQKVQKTADLNGNFDEMTNDLPEAKQNITAENELPSEKTKKEFSKSLIVSSPNYNRTVSISRINDDLSIVKNIEPQFIKNIDNDYIYENQEYFFKSPVIVENSSEIKLAKSGGSILKNEESLKEDIIGKAASLNAKENLSEGLEVASATPSSDLLDLKSNENYDMIQNSTFDSELSSVPIDNCSDKKNESIDLLNNDETSFSQKKMAYTILAECYEFEGSWQKALDNYITLQKFDISSKDIYQKKIDFIKANYIGR